MVATTSNKLVQTVTCSMDPNDKTVNPPGEQSPHYTLFGQSLFYTIHFQNTGNDTAYDVHILDTLDSNLDLSSLKIISSSHPVIVEQKINGVINFIFNNIMLPDSFVDEPASNGFVSFDIKPKDSLPEMTVIRNRAHIYFDQNLPVKTNQAFNTLVSIKPVGIPDLENKSDIIIYPNPFSESVTISNKNYIPLSDWLTITDMQGRELLRLQITSGEFTINLHNLAAGVYFYQLFNKNSNQTNFGRLIKQ